MAATKTALITGASSGIGKEFAVQLAEQNYHLILAARRFERLEEMRDALSRDYGIQVLPLRCDLAAAGAGAQLMEDIKSVGWGVDLLINNAGFGLRTKFHEGPLEHQLAMIDVNSRVVAELSHRLITHMLEERQGSAEGLINVASLAAWQPGPWMAVYFATKAFVLHFSEALYEEVKDKGLMVSVLCPGGVLTEFGDLADMADAVTFKVGAMTPKPVVEAAISGFRGKRPVIVPGTSNGLAAFGTRFAPRSVARQMAAKIMEPKG